MLRRADPLQSIDSKILRRVRGHGRGAVFVPGDFLDFGSRGAVDLVLHRLVRNGTLRRLARGLYDYPRAHPKLGLLSPEIEKVARALAGSRHVRLQPSAAYAANLLRLSDQVPARAEFLTDGPSRRVKVGAREIVLKRTTPRMMAAAGRISGLVFQGLHHLGSDHVSLERIAHLRELLPESDRRQVLKDIELAPAWMHPYLRAIAGQGPAR